MAMKDAKIKYLEHELEEKERVLEQMREVDREPTTAPVGEDVRIGALERRVRELEAVVKGLTEEVLDLKALTLKMAKSAERPEGATAVRARGGRAAVEPPAPAPAPTILVRPRNAEKLEPLPSSPSRLLASAEPAPVVSAEEMDLIMQTDGTIKPELRRKNEYIVAANGPQNRRQGGRSAGDRSARHVDAVIFAEEQELPRPPKKR